MAKRKPTGRKPVSSKPQGEKKEKKGNGLKIVLIIIIILLLGGIGGLYYLKTTKEKEMTGQIEELSEEKKTALAQIDSLQEVLLAKIDTLKQYKGETEKLEALVAELEEAKEKAKNSASYWQRKYNSAESNFKARLDRELAKKDQEIESLKDANANLMAQKDSLVSTKNELSSKLDSVSSISEEQQKKIDIAQILDAKDIKAIAINSRGKRRDDGDYKNRHIEKLELQFTIEENKVAEIETKEFYIVINEPNGSTIYDLSAGSGTFTYEDEDKYYTVKKDVLYNQSEVKEKVMYEKGSEYKEGRHTIEIYAEGHKIGEGSFTIK